MVRDQAWHCLSPVEVLETLGSNADSGLSSDEVKRRLLEYGPNELQRARRVSAREVFAAQFKNLLIVILLVAVVLSAILGHVIEAAAIGVIILFAALLGFYQEYLPGRS